MTNCLACVPKLVYNYQINLSEVLKAYLHNLCKTKREAKRFTCVDTEPCKQQLFVFVAVVALGTSKYKQQETQIQRQCNWRLSGSSMVASGAEFGLK